MKRMRPIVLGICSLILTSAIFTPAGFAKRAAPATPAVVEFLFAPEEVACIGDPIRIAIRYQYDRSTGLAPLAPLVPIGAPKKQDALPGVLILNSKLLGTLAQSNVSYGPGVASKEYKYEEPGQETLTASLDYGAWHGEAEPHYFEVKECNYQLVIKATITRTENNSRVESNFSAEGHFTISPENQVFGELRTDAWYDIYGNTPVVTCTFTPIPQADSDLVVSGTREIDSSGAEILHLKIIYGKLTNFPKSVEKLCIDNVKNKQLEKSTFPTPKSANPGDYLKENFDITVGQQITGPYGPGGISYYMVFKNK